MNFAGYDLAEVAAAENRRVNWESIREGTNTILADMPTRGLQLAELVILDDCHADVVVRQDVQFSWKLCSLTIDKNIILAEHPSQWNAERFRPYLQRIGQYVSAAFGQPLEYRCATKPKKKGEHII